MNGIVWNDITWNYPMKPKTKRDSIVFYFLPKWPFNCQMSFENWSLEGEDACVAKFRILKFMDIMFGIIENLWD